MSMQAAKIENLLIVKRSLIHLPCLHIIMVWIPALRRSRQREVLAESRAHRGVTPSAPERKASDRSSQGARERGRSSFRDSYPEEARVTRLDGGDRLARPHLDRGFARSV